MSTMTGILDEEIVDIAPALGTVIHGKYRLVRMVGEGAFAWVYRAQHETIESLRFAVKVLKPTYAQNPDILRRFKREAVTVANLQSRHTVRIFDFGVSEGGAPYIVMEFIKGISIAQLIKRDGPLTELQAARITVGMLKALEDAHSLGIVHRDLKPSNVLITKPADERFPIAKVLDFGIAKMLSGDDKQSAGADETVEGLLFCSPRYASPEILLGKPSLQSDLYSLGIIIAEMLEGEPPYGGDNNILVAAQHLGPDPVPLSSEVKASGLGSAIAKACAKDSGERYATAGDMLADVSMVYETLLNNAEEAETELNLDLTLPEEMMPPVPPSGQYASGALMGAQTPAVVGQPPYTQPMPKPMLTGQVPRPGNEAQIGYATGPIGTQGFETGPIQVGKKTNGLIMVAAIAVIVVAIFAAVKIAGNDTDSMPTSTDTATETIASTPPIADPDPVVPEVTGPTAEAMDRALRTAVRQFERAAATPRDNRFSLRANVEGAVATIGGATLPSLPITEVFAPVERPIRVTVSADGYDDLEIVFDRPGTIAYAAELEETRSRDSRPSRHSNSGSSSNTDAPSEPPPVEVPAETPPERTARPGEIRNPFNR